MATDFKSPLGGILDYLVPDYIEKQAISGFAQNPNPVNKQGNPLYGGFTPDIDPNNPTGLSNIQTLLGTAYMPQAMTYSGGKGPSNKQMINAAILRAGLELGKGRLPGENFGVALNRGMEAFGAPAKTLSDARIAQAKAAKSTQPQVSISGGKMSAFYNVGRNIFKTNNRFKEIVRGLTGGGWFDTESAAIRAITNNGIGYESRLGILMDDAIMQSAEALYANAQKQTKEGGIIEKAEGKMDIIPDFNTTKTKP